MKKAGPFPELPPEKLYQHIDPKTLPFNSTDKCKACEGIIGQERALAAIQTGLDIKSRGYNIFITGMVGTGRTTTIKKFLEKIEKTTEIPDDMLYVNNFRCPDEPVLIKLPAGKGILFQEAMNSLIEELKLNIPELLKSKYYSEKRDRIIENQQKKQKEELKEFEAEVAKEGFSLIQVQIGTLIRPDLIPMIQGKPAPFDQLAAAVREEKFPQETLEQLKKKYEELTIKLEAIFKRIKVTEEKTRALLKEWDKNSIEPVVKDAIAKVHQAFSNPEIKEYMDDVEADINKNIILFRQIPDEQKQKELGDIYIAYRVNLLIDNSELKGAPIIMETNPNFVNLFGSIEATMNSMGYLQTDFTKVRAGSFLKANGGYLVINALDALIETGVWTTLKRSLRNQTLEIQNLASLFYFNPRRLKPQPIDIDLKVILIGDARIYHLLYYQDEDFKKIFKIKAEFDSVTKLGKKTALEYMTFAKKIINEDNLLQVNRDGMAALMEYSIRLAGRRKKLSTRFHYISDVIREASYWAKKNSQKRIGREHIQKAILERFERVSLIEDKIQEMIESGTIMIDTKGSVVGQVNGLSVYQMGQVTFGKPTRITVSTSVGRAGVINIEREADLSGRTHNKGVLILGGYLRGKYAQDKPFALSASIAFEQAYSGIDGDSASSTEVYAILSSLSKLPLRQDIAVTGSLNQKGEIQPIGGVNEKIEGFFDVCKAKKLTGTQGVIIPFLNIENLMLREDVTAAVKEGVFHIYAVKTIDDGIEVLTGIKAGRKKKNGTFEPDTVHSLVDQELKRLALNWKTFGKDKNENSED